MLTAISHNRASEIPSVWSESVNARDQEGKTLFHHLVSRKEISIEKLEYSVKWYLICNADPTIKDLKGRTVLLALLDRDDQVDLYEKVSKVLLLIGHFLYICLQ